MKQWASIVMLVFSVVLVLSSCAQAPAPPTPAPTPAPTPEAEEEPESWVDPDIVVDIYDPEKAYNGTTLLLDNHVRGRPRIIEVNMLGEIVWEYLMPKNLGGQVSDVELLSNNNILFIVRSNGVYEIDRNSKIVWSYLTNKIDHDADRLPNGNTIFVFGFDDQESDAQVAEVNPRGEIVWTWYAKDYFDKPPYNDIYEEGWAHTNAVSRLSNGNTLISPRNFHFVVEVDPQGSVVSTYGEGTFSYQHDPEFLPNGNMIATLLWRDRPHLAVEFDIKTDEIVWQYAMPDRHTWPVRDANRLPNGNTLITGTTKIVEVTAEGEIVWQLGLKDITFGPEESAGLGFYKADRISIVAP